MKYKAVIFFKDLHDSNHAYNPGDKYPREGLQVSEKRLEELASNKNRRGVPVIEAIPEQEKTDQEPPAEAPKKKRTKKNAD